MTSAPEQETKEEAAQREAEHAQRIVDYEAEQKRREEERKADWKRQQQEYEAEQAGHAEVRKARLDTFERILANAPATFTGPQWRVFLSALIKFYPYDFTEEMAAFHAGDDESSQQTPEEVLLSTLNSLPDDKLTRFALCLVLSGHIDTLRENDFDFLTQAAAVFDPPPPTASRAKGSRTQGETILATGTA